MITVWNSVGRCYCLKTLGDWSIVLEDVFVMHWGRSKALYISVGDIWEHQQAFWALSDRLCAEHRLGIYISLS